MNPWSSLALADNLHYIIKNNNIIANTKNFETIKCRIQKPMGDIKVSRSIFYILLWNRQKKVRSVRRHCVGGGILKQIKAVRR